MSSVGTLVWRSTTTAAIGELLGGVVFRRFILARVNFAPSPR
ncbi:hypothetical protein [Xylanimonas protaetiae]|nr:hypothetical protein [Xylanimonas protaetiae]